MSFHSRASLIPHDATVAARAIDQNVKVPGAAAEPRRRESRRCSMSSMSGKSPGRTQRDRHDGTSGGVGSWPTRMWGAAATQEANPPSPPAGRTG